MHKVFSFNFVNLFRIFLIGLIVLFFHLFASQSYATQPTVGSWTSLGFNNCTTWEPSDDPNNANILFVPSCQGITKSIDAGTSWNSINANLGGYGPVIVDPTNSSVLYFANGAGVYKSTDGGANWTLTTAYLNTYFNVTHMVMDPNNHNILYSGNYSSGGVWKTTNGGATWTDISGSTDIARLAIDPTNTNIVYVGAAQLYKSTDGGATTFTDPSSGGLDNLKGIGSNVRSIAIDPSDHNILYVGGDASGIFKSIDGGVNWTVSHSIGSVLSTLIVDPRIAHTLYAADGNGVHVSSDGGATWSSINTGLPGGLTVKYLVIPANNPNVMYASTTNGMYVYGLPAINQPPTVNPISNATVNEGATYSANGSFTDTDSTSWTGTVDYGDGSGSHAFASPNESLNQTNQTFTISHVYKDEGTYTVTVTIIDNQGATSQPATATITVNNATPIVNAITVSTNPVQINTATSATATFTDLNTSDTHTATWNWGDGSTSTTGTVTESNGSGTVGADSHTYAAAGVYTITLTVTDDDGTQPGTQTFQYESVYNPTSQGLFSAGQKYTSPAGAYLQNTSLTGDVKFGLSYKYQGTLPVGDRQFTMNFNAASLTFNATTVSSLVIANGIGTLTGTGTINGSGTYTFLVTGSESAKTIRIQIKDSTGNVVYDTQPGAADTATPTTSVTGNVLAH